MFLQLGLKARINADGIYEDSSTVLLVHHLIKQFKTSNSLSAVKNGLIGFVEFITVIETLV